MFAEIRAQVQPLPPSGDPRPQRRRTLPLVRAVVRGASRALVVAEVSLSVALLITSGLLIRALWRLQAIDPGFQQAGVLTLRTALPTPKYEKVAQREAFDRDGYLFFPSLFSAAEMKVLLDEVPQPSAAGG